MTFRTILVGIEDTEEGRSAMRFATELARAEGATLHVASVSTDQLIFLTLEEMEEQKNLYFRQIQEVAEETISGPFKFHAIVESSVPAGITRVAEEHQADLIVIGSSHRGPIGRVLLGDASSRLVAGAPCAVAVTPRGWGRNESMGISRIGVAVNGSEESELGIEFGAALATDVNAELELIGVVPHLFMPGRVGLTNPGFQEVIEQDLESRMDEASRRIQGLEVESHLRYGDAADELTDASNQLDVLVIGSRGYGPVGRVLLGGVAVKVMRSSTCPVIVIARPPGSQGSTASSQ